MILAGTSNVGLLVQNTLGSGDNLNGGDGFDTLRVIDDATLEPTTFVPTTESVERFDFQANVLPSTINMINASGVAAGVELSFDLQRELYKHPECCHCRHS